MYSATVMASNHLPPTFQRFTTLAKKGGGIVLCHLKAGAGGGVSRDSGTIHCCASTNYELAASGTILGCASAKYDLV